MSKYAVIRIKGNQYKVSEGEELLVNKLDGKPSLEVLMVADGDAVKIGRPVLDKAKVVLDVVTEEVKGEKISVFTYKAKSRYRRKRGFRPVSTKVKVKSISS